MQPPITPVAPVPPSLYLEMQTQFVQGRPPPPAPGNQLWVARPTVENQPPDDVLWSLFNTMFLNSFCFGFIALIYSIKARDCKVIRDLEGATRFGKTARFFNIVAAIMGLIILIITIVLSATMARGLLKKWNAMQWSVARMNSYHQHN